MRELFSSSWHRVAQSQPKLRTPLTTQRQTFRGQLYHVLIDDFNHRFYRIQPSAYSFLSRLNGKVTVEEAWLATVEESPSSAPGQGEVIQLMSQLHSAGLLHSQQGQMTQSFVDELEKKKHRQQWMSWANILFLRVPLFDPNRMLDALQPLWRWLLSPVGVMIWLLVVGLGGKSIIESWQRLSLISEEWSHPQGILWLYLCLAVVKSIHELAHAAVCKHYGGEVHTMGVMLLMFSPIPYMDASAAWAFRERYKRVLTGAAGMLAEVFMASIAALVWAQSDDAFIHLIAANVMVICSVSTVLFNLNPLLKFDGYYIFSDLIDTPNLQQRALDHLKFFVESAILGKSNIQHLDPSAGRRIFLPVFSCTSTLYRVLITLTIITFIGDQWFSLGPLLATIAALVWVCLPIKKCIQYIRSFQPKERPPLTLTFTSLFIVLVAFIFAVPLPHSFQTTGTIEAQQRFHVHFRSTGELEQVHMPSGNLVKIGDVLASLSNPNLTIQKEQLQARLDEVRLRTRLARTLSPSSIASLKESEMTVLNKIKKVQLDIDHLTLTAQHDGVWFAPGLEHAIGSRVKRGDSVGQLFKPQEYIVSTSIPQSEVSRLFLYHHDQLQLDIRCEGQSHLSHTSLRWEISPAEQNRSTDNKPSEPVFEVRAELMIDSAHEQQDALGLLHQRTAHVLFRCPPQPLAQQLWRKCRQVFQQRYRI